MTSHPLPSDRFPLQVHFDVVRRFMSVSRNGADPVSPESVEGAGLPSGAAQENAAFLADVGFLIEESQGRYKPTPVAMQFINTQALDELRGRKLLRSLVNKLWFARVVEAVRKSDPNAGETELRTRIAEESSASSLSEQRAAGVLLEYLGYTGLIERGLTTSGSPQPPPPSGPPAAHATRAGIATRRASRAEKDPSAWRTLRTDDFELKIRADRNVVHRLRRQLDLLEEEIASYESEVSRNAANQTGGTR